jgi:hypothetical protein
MSDAPVPAKITPANRLLTSAEFQYLSAVPPEIEWFANIRNKSTRRAYENAIEDFMGFTGIARPEEFRAVTRAHVIACVPVNPAHTVRGPRHVNTLYAWLQRTINA